MCGFSNHSRKANWLACAASERKSTAYEPDTSERP
jgi:hypothetical protein